MTVISETEVSINFLCTERFNNHKNVDDVAASIKKSIFTLWSTKQDSENLNINENFTFILLNLSYRQNPFEFGYINWAKKSTEVS